MGFWGALIMSLFGTVFMLAAVVLHSGANGALLAVPIAVFAAFVIYALRTRRALAAVKSLSERADKAVMWSSIGEGVGILVAINLVKNLGHPDLVVPAITFVVGLHFLPMAFAIPFKPFYGLAVALIAASIVGVYVSQPLGSVFAAAMAGLSLWAAAMLAMRREVAWAATANSGG